MVARFDVRALQQLTSDTDSPTVSGSLASNDRMLAVLADASGMVEAACSVAGQYLPADLQALTGVSLSFLKRLVCDLAMGLLILARPGLQMDTPEAYERALETLKELRQGELVFGLIQQQDAGHLDVDVEPRRDVELRNGIVVESARYFGVRNNRLH
jgi:phage gp36-like protein